MKPVLYLIGSLRNVRVPEIAALLRANGWDVFDDWYACGPKADDHWREYEQTRGRSYADALKAPFAINSFTFDKHHLDRADAGLLLLPAGKSGHLEAGYLTGQGKTVYVFFDKLPEDGRWDVMYQFLRPVFSMEDLPCPTT